MQFWLAVIGTILLFIGNSAFDLNLSLWWVFLPLLIYAGLALFGIATLLLLIVWGK